MDKIKWIILIAAICAIVGITLFLVLPKSNAGEPVNDSDAILLNPEDSPGSVDNPLLELPESKSTENMMNKWVTVRMYPEEGPVPVYNPLIGFAPNATSLELLDDNTLVYMYVTWRNLEPREGYYDFDAFESVNRLDDLKKAGVRVVFRFVCDMPGSETHLDIPDWLYEKTGDGDWYDMEYGKGYSPNYANELFIERHKKAVEALGKRYGADDFFFYVQLGSLGHWGEWHVNFGRGIRRLPSADIREQYILPYIDSFPNSMILMRRSFTPAKEHGFGVYNDMAGDKKDTEKWLSWINEGGDYDQTGEKDAIVAMPGFWEKTPSGGEFTSGITMETMLGRDLSETLDLITRSHMSFIGPKIPSRSVQERMPDSVREIRSLLGYSLYISSVRMSIAPSKDQLIVTLYWKNKGIAPFYGDWPVKLYLLDSDGNIIQEQPVDIKLNSIFGSYAVESMNAFLFSKHQNGSVQVAVAIIDPISGKPAVDFAMMNKREDKIYILGSYTW